MVSGKSPEELPPGWKEHVKVSNGRKIKYYIHEGTRQKFYSRVRVIRSAETQEACNGPSHSMSDQSKGSNSSKSEARAVVGGKNASLDWLPPGWIMESKIRKSGSQAGAVDKKYVDPETGRKFFSKLQVLKYLKSVDSNVTPEKQKEEASDENCSKQDAPQNCESIEGKSRISGKEENGTGKEIVPYGIERSTVVDDLPPGWIKEFRARRWDPKRKDPFYIDPISGYEFRSKKDSLRYLETGDISFCVMKPKKSKVKFVEDAISVQEKTECLKVGLEGIDDHGAVSSTATAVLYEQKLPEAERSKETGSNCISSDTKATTVDVCEDVHLCSEVIRSGKSEHSCEIKIEGSEPSVKINDNGAVSSTGSIVLVEHAEDLSNRKTKVGLKKSQRKTQCMPARSSKRLSGQEPDILTEMVSSKRPCPSAFNKPAQAEATSSPAQIPAANGLLQLLGTSQLSDVCADLPSTCKVDSLEKEMPNNIEKPSQEQAVEEQGVGQVQERQDEENPRAQDSHILYPFGDSLSDPCYEFAFKTLTGEIPIEDTLAFQNLFQQPTEEPYTQGVARVGFPEVGTTSLFHNDVPYQLDSVQSSAPTDQLPTNSTIQSGNVNLPSCSSFGRQQPSLEARSKDYETKVNS